MTQKPKRIFVNFIMTPEVAQRVTAYMNVHKCNRTEALNALLAPPTQIEFIPKKSEEAKKLDAMTQAFKLKDEFEQKHFEREMKLANAKAIPLPLNQQVDWGAGGTGGKEISYKVPQETPAPEALKADAYGFYGDWDWTPEQLEKLHNAMEPRSLNKPKFLPEMQHVIPCQGIQSEDEWIESITLPPLTRTIREKNKDK